MPERIKYVCDICGFELERPSYETKSGYLIMCSHIRSHAEVSYHEVPEKDEVHFHLRVPSKDEVESMGADILESEENDDNGE